jgi:hypothetical protein
VDETSGWIAQGQVPSTHSRHPNPQVQAGPWRRTRTTACGSSATPGGSCLIQQRGRGESSPASGNVSGAFASPTVNLPPGSGGLRGIREKFAANLANGTGLLSIPLPVSPGPSSFASSVALAYDSGAGHAWFGMGWCVGLPSIAHRAFLFVLPTRNT